MEGELKRIQADIEQVKRAHKSELDKVNSEMGEVVQGGDSIGTILV